AALIGGLRALIVQSLHPLAMAGVAQHSDYRRRPLERLRRTAYYVGATAMGDNATALAAAQRVKQVHKRVHGIDPVTGRSYSADAREAIGFVVNPPLTRDLLPYWAAIRVLGQAALAIVPRELRRLAGIDRPRAVDFAAVAAVRPLVAASTRPPLRDLYGYALG